MSGLFGNIKQINYRKLSDGPLKFQATSKTFQEEYDAVELLKDKIYNYDLGKEKFIQLLNSTAGGHEPRHKIYTNYYFYQYVLSVHNGNKTGFIEKTLSQKYDPETNTHLKQTEISTIDILKINLLNSFRFHQMIKIIRFQIKNHCFEIIIPGHSFKVSHHNLYKNLSTLEFPQETTFIHKKVMSITTQKTNKFQPPKTDQPKSESKSESEAESKRFNPHRSATRNRKYIPRNRRKAYRPSSNSPK